MEGVVAYCFFDSRTQLRKQTTLVFYPPAKLKGWRIPFMWLWVIKLAQLFVEDRTRREGDVRRREGGLWTKYCIPYSKRSSLTSHYLLNSMNLTTLLYLLWGSSIGMFICSTRKKSRDKEGGCSSILYRGFENACMHLVHPRSPDFNLFTPETKRSVYPASLNVFWCTCCIHIPYILHLSFDDASLVRKCQPPNPLSLSHFFYRPFAAEKFGV